jgi:hypothetical protein
MQLFLEQHSEHRLVFDRIIALLEYYLLPQINFVSFIIIGNLALVVALVILYKSFRINQNLHIIYLLPVAGILFNFRYFETCFWPMAAMQNLWVLCFALASLFLLHAKNIKYSFYLSILFGWMATFTSANGMMVFIAGAFVLFINKELFTKKNLFWLSCGLLAMGVYFYNYHKPSYHPPILSPMLNNPMGFLGYAAAFLGGNFSESINVAIIIGVVLVIIVLFMTYKKFYRKNPVLFSFLVFLLITSLLAALTRFGFGIEQALSSKYAVNSAFLAVVCYMGLVSLYHHKIKITVLFAVTCLSFYFHFGTYEKYLPAKKAEKEEFEKNYALITQGKLSRFNYGWPPLDERKDLPRKALKMADSLGYFKFKFKEEGEIIKSIPSDSTKEIKYKLERFEQVQMNAIVMQGWAFIKGVNMDNMTTVLCLKDEKMRPVKYFICQQYARPDVTQANAADKANYNMSGFFTFYNPKEVPKGKYVFTIIITDGNYKTEVNTNQILNFQ